MSQDFFIGKGANPGAIRNKNEARVLELIPEVLARFPDYEPNGIDLEDIYALTLNNLPPRYVQHGGIVLREPVGNELILHEIERAVCIVRERPNH